MVQHHQPANNTVMPDMNMSVLYQRSVISAILTSPLNLNSHDDNIKYSHLSPFSVKTTTNLRIHFHVLLYSNKLSFLVNTSILCQHELAA